MFELKVDKDISLRLHDMSDLQSYFELIKSNYDHISRYLHWADYHQTVDDTRKYILYTRRQFSEHKEVSTKIYYQGQLVGGIGIILKDKVLRVGEIGYWLDKNATGKGIATRATRAFTDYGFSTLGLHKIIIQAIVDNEASLAIPNRLGYNYQGRAIHGKFHNNTYHDYATYYVLEDDWMSTLNSPEFSYRIDDDLELRILEPHHAEEAYAVLDSNREHLRQWLPWVDNSQSVEDTLDFINSSLNQYADDEGLQLGIWYKGKFCGECGLHSWDVMNKRAEIGYWLAKAYTGKGIMTRAVKALTNYAFGVLDLHRVEIQCVLENRASCAIAERLGFTHEGVIRDAQGFRGKYLDCNIYSLLSDE